MFSLVYKLKESENLKRDSFDRLSNCLEFLNCEKKGNSILDKTIFVFLYLAVVFRVKRHKTTYFMRFKTLLLAWWVMVH